MSKENNQTEQFARELLEMIHEVFGTDQNFQVTIETPDGKVSFGCKEDECECKERLKKEVELTFGEKYILYLLNNHHLCSDNVSFDSVMDTIITNPLYDFMLNSLKGEVRNEVLNFLSQLTESLVKVDFSKIRKL